MKKKGEKSLYYLEGPLITIVGYFLGVAEYGCK